MREIVAPDIGADLIEAALAEPAIASLRHAGAPVVVVSPSPARVVFATGAAIHLFGGDLASLSRRLLGGGEPGSFRLANLSRSLLAGATPRLERLRFFFGPVAETVTVLCRRATEPHGAPLFVFAVMGARPQKNSPADVSTLVTQPADPFAAPPHAMQVALAESMAHEPHVAEAVEPPLLAVPVARGKRFVWRSNANHHITFADAAFEQAIGCEPGALAGQSLSALAPAIDPSGALEKALSAHTTWSGIAAHWPIAGMKNTLLVALGALAAFDAQGAFTGYRGYGLITGAPLAVAEPGAADDNADKSDETVAAVPGHDEVSRDSDALDAHAHQADAPVHESAAHNAPASEGSGNVFMLRPHQGTSAPISRDPDHSRANDDHRPAAQDIAQDTAQDSAQDDDAHADEAHEEKAKAAMIALALTPVEHAAFSEIGRTLGADAHDGAAHVASPDDVAHQHDAAESQENQATVHTDEPVVAALDAEAAALAQHATTIIDTIPVGIIVTRQEVPLYLNRTMLDLLGYADADAFHDDGGLAKMFAHEPAPANSSGPEEAEHPAIVVTARNGDAIRVNARVQTIEWDGLPASLMTLRAASAPVAPVTPIIIEPPHQRDEVRELRAILDTATDGVAVIDGSGKILSINRSGEALFGYDESELVGEPISTLVSRESHVALSEYIEGVKAGGVASMLNDGRDIIGRARQGGMIPLFMTIGRIGSDSDPRFCAVLRDQTAWKKVERELNDAKRDAEKASAQKSDFLAKISHEIRTPLNAIIGFAEVIMDERFGPVGNERYKDYMKDIHRSGEHVMSLVNDLLDLSKIEAGKMDLTFTAVDANSIVSECVSLLQPQASRERVVIRLSLAPRLPRIVADERSLRQIVLNILSNAVKYNEPGGQVIVSTALTDAGHAVVRIRDTGLGMSDSELQTALEPFRQIATARNISGTGLGLPLTKALVEANRASFTIKSQKNEGTMVEVVFPPPRVLAQ